MHEDSLASDFLSKHGSNNKIPQDFRTVASKCSYSIKEISLAWSRHEGCIYT